jgi:hypothetical protein
MSKVYKASVRMRDTFGKCFAMAAAGIRKASKPKRFDRLRASRQMTKRTLNYWVEGNAALIAYMNDGDKWARLQRELGVGKTRKAISPDDRQILVAMLAEFAYYEDLDEQARIITEAALLPTFEDAAKFALKKLGVASPSFELKNARVKDNILGRASALVKSSNGHQDAAVDTILRNFYDLGRNPYDDKFVAELKKTLNRKADWEARRFALTETGIVSEVAQHEVYKRSGVEAKRWNATGANTRQSHLDIAGAEIPIEKKFSVGGRAGAHPLDPALPANEIVNCHCWLSPVVDENYSASPDRIWEGS